MWIESQDGTSIVNLDNALRILIAQGGMICVCEPIDGKYQKLIIGCYESMELAKDVLAAIVMGIRYDVKFYCMPYGDKGSVHASMEKLNMIIKADNRRPDNKQCSANTMSGQEENHA